MNSLARTFLIVLLALMTVGRQAAPVRMHNCTPDSSTTAPENSTDALNNPTPVNTTTTSHNITVLQTDASIKIYGVFQEIRELENYTVRRQMYIYWRSLSDINNIFSCLCIQSVATSVNYCMLLYRGRFTICPLMAAMYGLNLPTML